MRHRRLRCVRVLHKVWGWVADLLHAERLLGLGQIRERRVRRGRRRGRHIVAEREVELWIVGCVPRQSVKRVERKAQRRRRLLLRAVGRAQIGGERIGEGRGRSSSGGMMYE